MPTSPMARTTSPFILCLLLFLQSIATEAADCYTKSGTVDLDQQPCPGVNDTSPGSCCYSTGWPNVDMCMSNGLCLSTVGGYMYTGACTDKDWSSEYCNLQKLCTEYYGGTANYAVVTPCYIPQTTPGSVCCGFQGDSRTKSCCANNSGFNFSQDSSTSLFLGPMNASSLLNITTSVAALESDSDSDTGSGTSAVAETTQYVTTSAIPEDYVKSSVAIGVGVGLGVPLLIALASAGWLWMALRKQKLANGRVQQQADTVIPAGGLAPGHGQGWSAPTSPPAELKATNEIQEVPSEPYRVEAPTERM